MQETENAGMYPQKLPPLFKNGSDKSPNKFRMQAYEERPLQEDNNINLQIKDGPGDNYNPNSNYQLPPGFLASGATRGLNPPMGNQVNEQYGYNPEREAEYQPQEGQPDLDPNSLSKNLSAQVRLGFIRKVYSILLMQVAITAALTIATLSSMRLRAFMIATPGMMWGAIALYVSSLYALACYSKVARSVPINYILLFVFTVSMSWVVAFISSLYSPQVVTSAAILTALMMIGLTAYACYTKTDFTMMGGMLFAGSLILIGMILLGIFITNKFYHAAIAAGILLLMSVYVIYDTQLIVGKHSYKYLIDDYILAALNLYLDRKSVV